MDVLTAFIRLRRSIYHFLDANHEDKKKESVNTASYCLRVLVEEEKVELLNTLTPNERSNLRGMIKDNPLVYILQD